MQNLERLLFRQDAELQIANDRHEESRIALRVQRERHLSLIGYGMTHILGTRNLIISDGEHTDIQQYSLEEKLHSDVMWLWRYCRSEDNHLPDLIENGNTIEDKFGDTLGKSS